MYQISMRKAGKCDTNSNIKALKLLSRLDNHISKVYNKDKGKH
jgi:hypothetical protein